MINQPEDELKLLIASESKKLFDSFGQNPDSGIDSRVALIELSRAKDFFYSRSFLTRESNDTDLEIAYAYGTPKTLCLFLDECINKTGVPLISSNDDLQKWSHSCIYHAGKLSSLERLVECIHERIFKIQKTTKTRYEITPIKKTIDAEAFDVTDQSWLRNLAYDIDSSWHSRLAKQLPDILQRMRKHVYPWRDKFIGYTTDPVIDDYFEDAGIVWARTLDGQVELPGDGMIGGYPFYSYRAAVAVMCGRALKHLYFLGELSLRSSGLDLHNLVTIWGNREDWVNFFQEVLDVDSKTASHLLQSLTLDQEYKDAFSTTPGSPMPPLIQVGKDDLMLSISGCLENPFWFLQRKLRFQYRQDWDKLMDSREDIFRKDLYKIFPLNSIITSSKPTVIRQNGREVTDIDAAAFDKEHGILILFQLKWQDPFGCSMRERRSRGKNFFSTSNKWIDLVHDWVLKTENQDLLDQLGIEAKHSETPIKDIQLTVLSRHHARFTNIEEFSNRALWGTWPQACRILMEKLDNKNLLGTLVKNLKAELHRSNSPRSLNPETFHIRGIEVIFDPS